MHSPSKQAASAHAQPDARGIPWPTHRVLRRSGLRWGLRAGAALVLISVGLLALASPLVHVVGELERLWYWTVPLVVSFATHVGLFAYGRGAAHRTHVIPASAILASGVASTLSMLAAGAHDLARVLSPIGLAGGAALVVEYQLLFLLVGLLANLVGLVYMLGLMHQHHLFPARRSLLSVAAGRRVDRAVFPVALASAAVFVFATIVTVVHRWWGW